MTTTDTEIQTIAHRIHQTLATTPERTILTFTPTGEVIATGAVPYPYEGELYYDTIAEDDTNGWTLDLGGYHLTEERITTILEGAYWAVEHSEDWPAANAEDLPLNERRCVWMNVFGH